MFPNTNGARSSSTSIPLQPRNASNQQQACSYAQTPSQEQKFKKCKCKSEKKKQKKTSQMRRSQTKPAAGKHSASSLHTVIRQNCLFTLRPLLAVTLVIIQLCEREYKYSLHNQECSLDYSDMGQCACAGSEITVSVSSVVRHGI